MAITQQQKDNETVKQHEAAHRTEPQVRLVAGPGTGKSSTIEERILWLLESNVNPTSMAVVSFTRASSRDLELRVRASCAQNNQPGGNSVSVTTLHSLALKLLWLGGLLQYYPGNPLVLDNWELENIYDKEFGEACNIASKVRREEIRRFYEAVWSTGVPNSPTYVPPANPITPQEQQMFEGFHTPTAQVYSCVLPGEILRKCVDAISTGNLNAADLLRIAYLVVDEYQDLNPADLEFVDLLAAQGVNVFVAGDDDQSIYSFRHASTAGIQTFRQRFNNAATRTLDGCFRCTPAVLAAATSLITHNAAPNRIPKNLTSLYSNSDPPNPGVVHRWRLGNAQAEANAIADSCSSLRAAGLSPSDILVLLATRDSRVQLWLPIKLALESAQLPFEPPKEEGFIDSAPGRLVLALTRIICSRNAAGVSQDFVAHRVLLGLKSRVGVATCNSIRGLVLTTANASFRDWFYGPMPTVQLSARQRNALDRARQTCGDVGTWSSQDTVDQRGGEIAAIIERTINTGASDAWVEYMAGLMPDMNLSELRDYLWADTDEQRATVGATLNARLGKPDDPRAQLPPKIRVMTMHGAKGLSAKVVFIPGLEQGILPNQHQIPYPAQLLEAARLLYVSITRAKACCILSYAMHRRVFGQSQNQGPSQFALQTGGGFVWRQNGLTQAEAQVINESINRL